MQIFLSVEVPRRGPGLIEQISPFFCKQLRANACAMCKPAMRKPMKSAGQPDRHGRPSRITAPFSSPERLQRNGGTEMPPTGRTAFPAQSYLGGSGALGMRLAVQAEAPDDPHLETSIEG